MAGGMPDTSTLQQGTDWVLCPSGRMRRGVVRARDTMDGGAGPEKFGGAYPR